MGTNQNSNENRKNLRKRSATRKKAARRLAFVVLIIVLIVAGVFFLSNSSRTNYDNSSDFTAFVDDRRQDIDFPQTYNDNTDLVEYGDRLSVALRLPKSNHESVNSLFSDISDAMIKSFRRHMAKSEKAALFVDYESYESDGICSIAVHKEILTEKDDEMVPFDTKVYTYSFAEKSGRQTGGTALLGDNYKSSASDVVSEALKDEYGDSLAKNWRDYVSADKNNLNSFVRTKGDVIFFFDRGTVLKDQAASVQVNPNDISDFTPDPDFTIDKNRPMIAITYDDGLNGPLEERLLKCLKKNDSRATFFLLGTNVNHVDESAKILKKMTKQGCELANHSWDHPQLTKLSGAKIRSQMNKTNNLVKKLSGADLKLYRAPYGAKDKRVIKSLDMTEIGWSYDTLDWLYRDADKVFRKMKQYGNLDGLVILLHSIHEPSIETSEKIIPWLRLQGYQMVTVSELAEYKYGIKLKPGKSYGAETFWLDDSEKMPLTDY